MIWPRRLWFWSLDSWLALWWLVRYGARPGSAAQLLRGTRAPVLLLPGVYETWHFLLPAARRLHAAGHPVHALPTLGHNRTAIPDAAALAQRYLEQHDLRAVVILGHSKGGLIGKHMMAIDDVHGRIARMVTLATPFSGSRLARYAPVRTLRVFRPEGRTLSTLARNYALNSRITSIYGEFDPVVPASSVLEGGTNVELPIVGHFRILRDPRALAAVEAAVDPLLNEP
jgi:hypothetical protein